MAEDGRREHEDERSPALQHQMFVVMEDLLDKLKLLDYEEQVLEKHNMKPLSRHYFVASSYTVSNPGEQFYMFSVIAAWLRTLCGRSFETPQEYDDPNVIVSNILTDLRAQGGLVDFPPFKLKSGSGEHVCYVLDRLAEEALRCGQFVWKRPLYPSEELEEESVIEDDAELTISKMEELTLRSGRPSAVNREEAGQTGRLGREQNFAVLVGRLGHEQNSAVTVGGLGREQKLAVRVGGLGLEQNLACHVGRLGHEQGLVVPTVGTVTGLYSGSVELRPPPEPQAGALVLEPPCGPLTGARQTLVLTPAALEALLRAEKCFLETQLLAGGTLELSLFPAVLSHTSRRNLPCVGRNLKRIGGDCPVNPLIIEVEWQAAEIFLATEKELQRVAPQSHCLRQKFDGVPLRELHRRKMRPVIRAFPDEAKELYQWGSGGVTKRTRTMAEISEELEKIKQEIDEKGSSMSDGAPVVKIRQSLTKLKQEIQEMDV
ncbi:LOW QUALITY PROTEIN: uncharacterized protein LOC108280285 [Ictalurus punctatus]|uniref:Intraflagellar transport protein 57 homolog n=1 Tax=Ictalurus punctatus TaxID=7998 RepID=A0A9F7QNS2_ICTPU|nr:LOW QUALITY PROTEIN: uncharacterized protein LOC108280285 [Ictalurus punctatus]